LHMKSNCTQQHCYVFPLKTFLFEPGYSVPREGCAVHCAMRPGMDTSLTHLHFQFQHRCCRRIEDKNGYVKMP
jgi:hypothetical protein